MKKIRVVIPAYNSDDTLERCLTAVFKSTVIDDTEVVIADDGKNHKLEHIKKKFNVEVREGKNSNADNTGIWHQNSVSYARNKAAEGFLGEVIVFVDSDVVIDSDCLEKLETPILSGETESTVGNYSRNVEGLSFLQSYKQLYIHKQYSRTGFCKDFFWTAVGGIKNSLFLELGGFDETPTPNPQEDIEIAHRIVAGNNRILAVPKAQGKHLKDFTLWTLMRNDFTKGMGTFYLHLLNKTPLTSTQHTKSSDIASVFFAYLFLLVAFLSLFLSSLSQLLLLPLFLCYLYNRKDLLEIYTGYGKVFMLKSLGVMYILDLVRGTCIPAGYCKPLIDKLS